MNHMRYLIASVVLLAGNTAWSGILKTTVYPGSVTNSYLAAGSVDTTKLGSGSVDVTKLNLNNGNVGIGTTNPGYKLDVAGVIQSTGTRVNPSSYYGGAPDDVLLDYTTSNGYGWRVDARLGSTGDFAIDRYSAGVQYPNAIHIRRDLGYFCIGTANPVEMLDISSGTIHFGGSGTPNQSQALCINSSGQLSTCSSVVGVGGGCTCP